MLSSAGRYFERIKVVKPMSGNSRKKMYASLQVKVPKKTKVRRDVSFDSITRSARDSYILRHTKEIILDTNYHPRYQITLETSPRQIIAKGQFTRIIGNIINHDYSVPLSDQCDHRCKNANIPLELPFIGNKKISNRQDYSRLENLQLKKLSQSMNEKSINSQVKDMKSTRDSFIHKTLDVSTSLNEEGMKHKHKFTENRAHRFESDSPHQFLKEVYDRYQMPEYDIVNNKHEGVIKRSMAQPKGYVKFYQYRDIVKNRQERIDPQWHTRIQSIDTEKVLKHRKEPKSIDLSKSLQRIPDKVHSRYSIQQSQTQIADKSSY